MGSNENSEHCFLCHQKLIASDNSIDQGLERINIEKTYIDSEEKEIENLLTNHQKEKSIEEKRLRNIAEEISLIDNRLAITRRAVASIDSPELVISDMEIGRIQERIRQLERISGTLEYREVLLEEINKIQKEVDDLEDKVNKITREIDFERAAQKLSDGMTSFLNALSAQGNSLWDLGRVNWKIRERSFDIFVRESKWSTKLGGTLSLYFLIAYHYALMELSNKEPYHYPGLVILDFQPKLDDGTIIKDQENFVLEPFIKLLKESEMRNTQLIAAGAAFEGLEDTNRIVLEHIWK